MSLCGATAALASGFVKASFGFHMLANVATALAAGLLVVAWFAAARMRIVSGRPVDRSDDRGIHRSRRP